MTRKKKTRRKKRMKTMRRMNHVSSTGVLRDNTREDRAEGGPSRGRVCRDSGSKPTDPSRRDSSHSDSLRGRPRDRLCGAGNSRNNNKHNHNLKNNNNSSDKVQGRPKDNSSSLSSVWPARGPQGVASAPLCRQRRRRRNKSVPARWSPPRDASEELAWNRLARRT